MIYAYIRVSTKHQNIDKQYEEIKGLDINDKYIYIDREFGNDFDRTKYQKLIKKLKKRWLTDNQINRSSWKELPYDSWRMVKNY